MSTYTAGLKTALLLNGTWTDISNYVYDRSVPASLTTTAGRQDETTTIGSLQVTGQLNNRDTRFTSRNPTGPYYPYLGRNTPVRLSVPASNVALRIENDAQSYAQASDVAAFHITGDIDIRISIRLTNYMPCTLAYRWGAAKAWQLQLNGDGTVSLNWFDGTNTNTATSTAPVPLGWIWIRAELAVASGTVTFTTAPPAGSPQTQLGAQIVSGATSLGAGSGQPLIVGHHSVDVGPQSWQGRCYEFQLRNGINGTLVADPVFSAQSDGTSSFSDAQSNSWSTQGTAEISGRAYIAHGELSELPVSWDPSGHDVWLGFQAGGIWRRLAQGNAPSLSVMRRWVSQLSNVMAWWPCEDMTQSSLLATGLASGGFPMYVQQGELNFASNSDLACSDSLPVVNGAVTTGAVALYTAGTTTAIRFLFSAPAAGDPLSRVIDVYLTGTLGFVRVLYQSGPSNGIDVDAGGGLASTGSIAVDGKPCLVSVELTTSGANVVVALNIAFADGTVQTTTTGTATSVTTGVVRSVQVNGGGNTLSKSAFGHVYVQSPMDSISTLDGVGPVAAWTGETAGNRFARLCQNYGIQPRIYGYPDETVVMGAQPVDTLTNLLQSCEDADRGQINEPPDSHSLGYRTLRSQCNQAPALTLDYSKAQAGDQENSPVSLTSVDDDQYTTNDWIISRTSGSSFEAMLDDGSRMSVTAPEQGGIGTYQNSKTANVSTDSQLPDIAGWMLHVSTTNEERYPSVVAGLHRAPIIAAGLTQAILDVRVGDYLEIINPPAWLPPGPLKMIVTAAAHNLANALHQVSWNCVPESPYEVLQYDSGLAWDTDGSHLHATITSGATTMQVTIAGASPPSPLWTTSAGDFPFNIIMDGEVMTVTNITGASSPQTFTVTRSVNGVVKAHNAGPPLLAVNVYVPPVWALT